MRKKGVIINKKDGKIYIDLENDSMECKTCGFHRVCNPSNNKGTLELHQQTELPIGSIVILEMSEGRTIFTSFLLFIMPLIIILGGYFLFTLLNIKEAVAILCALLAGAIYLVVIIVIEKLLLNKMIVTKYNDNEHIL